MNGTTLFPHVDVDDKNRVINAILNIKQSVAEEWPFYIKEILLYDARKQIKLKHHFFLFNVTK